MMIHESQLVRSLTELVADVLAEQRIRDTENGVATSNELELQLARSTVSGELGRLLTKRSSDAWPPVDENEVINEVIAQVLGLGGLEGQGDRCSRRRGGGSAPAHE